MCCCIFLRCSGWMKKIFSPRTVDPAQIDRSHAPSALIEKLKLHDRTLHQLEKAGRLFRDKFSIVQRCVELHLGEMKIGLVKTVKDGERNFNRVDLPVIVELEFDEVRLL